MVRRYELSEDAFGLIDDPLPANGQPGGQWKHHRTTFNGILWKLHMGAGWREIPKHYRNRKSVYDRFNR
jgi:transposase